MKNIVFNKSVYYLPYVAAYAYLDLRSQPARIDEIPELKWEPRLKPLVSLLNDPVGDFMTHGCAVASQIPGVQGGSTIPIPHGAKTAPCWYSSYVIFSFWFLNRNEKDHYQTIFDAYPSDKNAYNLCFEVEPAYFCTPYEQMSNTKMTESETNGAICGIWVSGWGTTADEAQARWHGGINDLVAFFAAHPFAVADPSAPTGVTLSQHMFGRVRIDRPPQSTPGEVNT